MATFTNTKTDEVSLVQNSKSGRIIQIALSPEQHLLLQSFVATISKLNPVIQMSDDYDLILKSDVAILKNQVFKCKTK